MTDEELRAVEEQLELVVKIIRLSPAVMPVLCGVLCRYEGIKRLIHSTSHAALRAGNGNGQRPGTSANHRQMAAYQQEAATVQLQHDRRDETPGITRAAGGVIITM
jgi:hypothetical protein